MVRLNETTKVSQFFVRIFVVFALFTYIIKLPETAKDETVKAEEWYEPWFVLCGTKPENGEKEL